MTKIIAPAGKAIVTLKPAESLTPGGLIIPESHRKPSVEAIVVSSGVADVEPGDTVILSGEYAGASFTVDKQQYIAVLAEEILVVV